MANYIRYANEDATRNEPLSPELVNALAYLQNLGVTADVFSGGQPSEGPNRVGSHRHDHGNAADVVFYKDGRPLDWANPNDLPLFEKIVENGRAAGLTGFGAGPGYMREGSMHIGFGTPGVWGAGGKGANAPEWLRTAYNTPMHAGEPAPPLPPAREVADLPVAGPREAAPAAVATAPATGGAPVEQKTGIGATLAALAPAFSAGMGDMGVGAPAPMATYGTGDPMGATIAAQQAAQKAKMLQGTLMPDAGMLASLGKSSMKVG